MATPDTKDRILDAAEEIFAERGYEAASLRAITGAAGVNLAAGNYHFGSKRGLFRATFERRVHDVNEERLKLFDALELEHPDGIPIELLLEAFIGPPLRYAAQQDEGQARFIRLMGRVMSESGKHLGELMDVFRPVQARFMPALQRSLPHLAEEDVIWRFHLLLGSMTSLITNPGRLALLSGGRCDAADPEQAVAHAVTFAAHGFRAPAVHGNFDPKAPKAQNAREQ
jgi:AcrR family transcriptional regulator